jgi:vitamin-K-epoxide reductase (warfarin-sensitive)
MILAVLGVLAASAALHEHYYTGTSPCSINDRWDCGVVNHSPYAVIAGVPVAAIGIGGYLLLFVLALKKARRALVVFAALGLAFSLYLSHIEMSVLQVWCIYCVFSLGMISLIAISAFLWMVWPRKALEARETK